MRKILIFIFGLTLIFIPLFGQNLQRIHIQANKSKTFNLSEIAEQVEYISLESTSDIEFDDIRDVLWTENFLFVQVSSIELDQRTLLRTLQYDHSGKFIREFGNEEEKMRKLLYDRERDRLFVNYPKGITKELNFEKNVKKIYEFKSNPQLYNNGYFYSQYCEIKENGMYYFLIRINEQRDEIDTLYHFKDNEKDFGFTSRPACISLYGQTPLVSFGIDNCLYQIRDKIITPIVKFTIDPEPSTGLDNFGYQFQGFIANYLCIHYVRAMQPYLYLKSMRSGKILQTKYCYSEDMMLIEGIRDDMLNTGFCIITPFNRSDYFYFVKKEMNYRENLKY